MKIINKKPILGVEKSLIWATLRNITQKTVSQKIRRVYLREAFSAVLHLIRTKEHQTSQEYIPSGLQKKETQINMYTTLALGKLVYNTEGIPTLESQEGRLFIFIFSMDILYFWPMTAYVQCMFDRPQTDCFS